MAPHIARWLQDTAIMRWAIFGDPRPLTVQEIEEHLTTMHTNPNVRLFGIFLPDATIPIGEAAFQGIDWKNRSALYSILIGDPEFRGRGLGTEATMLMVSYGFDDLNLHRIEALVLAGNGAAIRCLHKVGFVQEGIKREAIWKDGKWHDVILFGKLSL